MIGKIIGITPHDDIVGMGPVQLAHLDRKAIKILVQQTLSNQNAQVDAQDRKTRATRRSRGRSEEYTGKAEIHLRRVV